MRSRLPLILAISAALITGSILRVAFLTSQGLWHDEFYTLGIIAGYDLYLFPDSDMEATEALAPASVYQAAFRKQDFHRNFARNIVHEGHPPLYYMATWAWTSAFGRSPPALRSLSAISAVLLVAVLTALAHAIDGRRSALLMAILASAAPFLCYFAGEARSYSPALLLLTAAALAAVRWVSRPNHTWRTRAAFAVLATFCAYTHYYSIPALFIIGLAIIYFADQPRLSKRIAWTLLPFAAFALWLPVLRSQTQTHAGDHWTEGSYAFAASLKAAATTTASLLLNPITNANSLELAGLVFVILLAALGLMGATDARARSILIFCPLAFTAFYTIVIALDALTDHHTIAIPRYNFAVIPLLLIWISAGISRLAPFTATIATVLTIVGFLLSLSFVSGARLPRQMLRESATYITDSIEPGEVVLVSPAGPTLAGLAYYLPSSTMLAATTPSQVDALADAITMRGHGVWVVRQNLGPRDASSATQLSSTVPQANPNQPPPFSGVRLEHWTSSRP